MKEDKKHAFPKIGDHLEIIDEFFNRLDGIMERWQNEDRRSGNVSKKRP